jgi:hypothetical protein
LPVAALVVLAGAAILWTFVHKAQREKYYTAFIYRRLADIARTTEQRLRDISGVLQLQRSQPIVTKLLQGSGPEAVPLYLYIRGADRPHRASLDQLARPPAQDVFDDLIVCEKDGRVRYQHSWQGRRFENLRSLLEPRTESKEVSPLEREFRVFQQGVRLSARGVRLSFAGSDPVPKDELELIVVGLISRDRLDSEELALPYTVSLGFLFAALMLLSGLSMARLCLLRPLQRLRRRDGIWVMASTFLTVSLVTFGLLSFVYFKLTLSTEVDRKLEQLADEVQKNARQDFANLGRILARFTQAQCTQARDCAPQAQGSLAEAWAESPERTAWALAGVDQINWVNTLGNQKAKFALELYADNTDPPLLPVPDRQYVRAILEKRLWKDDSTETGWGPFFVEPVYSRTNGENVAFLSRPFADVSGKSETALQVAAIAARPASLFGTFFPPGYGFAIIDQDGKVLFHSREERNLHERLLDDLTDKEPLESAVFGRSAQDISSAYLGRDHHLHARPFAHLAGNPWTLVVFSDKEYFRSALAGVLTFALALYVPYAVVMLTILGLLLAWVAPPRAPGAKRLNPLVWLWPDPERYHGYHGWIAAFAVALAVYVVGLFTLTPVGLMALTLVLPPAALIAGYRQSPPRGLAALSAGSPLRDLSHGVRFTLATTLLLQLMAAMPATAFFRVAFDYKMRQLARHEQLQLRKHLQKREEQTWTAARRLYRNEQHQGDFVRLAREKMERDGVYSEVRRSWTDQVCDAADAGVLDRLRSLVPGLYDRFAVETAGTVDSLDPEAHWCKSNAAFLWEVSAPPETLQVAGPQDGHVLQLSSTPRAVTDLLGNWAILFSLAPALIVFGWMYFLNGRLLLFADTPTARAAASGSGSHTLVLTDLKTPGGIAGGPHVVDFGAQDWATRVRALPDGSEVALLRLERIVDQPELEEAARVIEESKNRLRMTIYSAVDPLLHLELNRRAGAQQQQAAGRLALLSHALTGFAWQSARISREEEKARGTSATE